MATKNSAKLESERDLYLRLAILIAGREDISLETVCKYVYEGQQLNTTMEEMNRRLLEIEKTTSDDIYTREIYAMAALSRINEKPNW